MRRRIGTIGAHLVALVALQLVLVLGLISFEAIQDFRTARHDGAASAQTAANLGASKVAELMNTSAQSIDQLPQYGSILASPGVCGVIDSSNQDWGNGLRSRLVLVHHDGTPWCDGSGWIAGNNAGVPWIQEAMQQTKPLTVGRIVDPMTKKQSYLMGAALQGYDAIVGYAVQLDSIGPALAKQVSFGESRPLFVLETTDGKSTLASSFTDRSNTERVYGTAKVGNYGWTIRAGLSLNDILAAPRRELRDRLAFAGLVVFIVLCCALIIQRRFVRPIRSISRATKRIAEGEFDAHVEPKGPVELSSLADSFNKMVDVRAEAERALEKAYKAERRAAAELREVDQMRNAFLMAISHELRTPLTAVVGYASMLQEGGDFLNEEETERSIAAIATQSQKLERLLLDLLDVERLSRGTIEPQLKETDIRALVWQVVQEKHQNGRIKVDMRSTAESYVDPALTERIIENLVVNALKHTPLDSSIVVRAKRRNGSLEIAVDDSGNGVPDDLKSAIFEPFKQGDVPSHSPGTGIGLSLVSQFAKLHGGKAWVEDRKGGGSSFRVTLPAVCPKKLKGARRTAKAA